MKKDYIKILSFLTTLLVSTIAAGCDGSTKTESHEEGDGTGHAHGNADKIEISELQMTTVGIDLGMIESKPIGEGISVNGILAVSPDHIAEISPLISGRIAQITVKEGSSVTAGQIVAWIENLESTGLQRSYISAMTQLNLSETELRRQEKLAEAGAGVARNLERAEIEYKAAKADLENIIAQLRIVGIDPLTVTSGKVQTKTSIKAPISGIVTKIYGNIGSLADLGVPIMQITNNNGVFALLNVYEKDLNSVKQGQKVTMSLTNGEGTLAGTVESINPSLNVESMTADVRVRIANHQGLLIPGMPVNATIDLESVMTPVVPEGAVVAIGDKSYIYRLLSTEIEDNQKMYVLGPVEVVTGVSRDGFVEIHPVENLPENTKVVISKAFYIASMANDHGEHNH